MRQLECRLEDNEMKYILKEVITRNSSCCMFANQPIIQEKVIETLSITLPNLDKLPEPNNRYISDLIIYLKKNAGKTLQGGGVFTSERPSYFFETYKLGNKVLQWLPDAEQSEFTLHNKLCSTFYEEAIALDRIRLHTKENAYVGKTLPCGAIGMLLLGIILENDLPFKNSFTAARNVSSYSIFHVHDQYETKLMEDDAWYDQLSLKELFFFGYRNMNKYYFTDGISTFAKTNMQNPLIQEDIKENELIKSYKPDHTI